MHFAIKFNASCRRIEWLLAPVTWSKPSSKQCLPSTSYQALLVQATIDKRPALYCNKWSYCKSTEVSVCGRLLLLNRTQLFFQVHPWLKLLCMGVWTLIFLSVGYLLISYLCLRCGNGHHDCPEVCGWALGHSQCSCLLKKPYSNYNIVCLTW